MNYLRRSSAGIMVSKNTIEEINTGLIKHLNCIASDYLRDINTIQKILKKKYNIKTNIPIVINRDICLILSKSIRDQNCVLINICEIREITKVLGESRIFFYDGTILLVEMSYSLLRKRLKQAREILEDLTL